jgi:hypothetical protein
MTAEPSSSKATETQQFPHHIHHNQIEGEYGVLYHLDEHSGQARCYYTVRGKEDVEARVKWELIQLSPVHTAALLSVDEYGIYTLFLPEDDIDKVLEFLQFVLKQEQRD